MVELTTPKIILYTTATQKACFILIFVLILLYHFDFSALSVLGSNLIGLNNLIELICVLLIVVLFLGYNSVSSDENLKKHQNLALFYIFLTYGVLIYATWKSEFIIHQSNNFLFLAKRSARFILIFVMYFVLLKRINSEKLYKATHVAILAFAIFFGFATLFRGVFLSVGFNILTRDSGTVLRNTGLFFGDINFFGAYLAMIFGYIFARAEKLKMNKFVLIALISTVVGIAQTASRGALIGIICIVALFIYRNKNKPNFKHALVALIIVGIVIIAAGGTVIARLFLKPQMLIKPL